MEYSIAIILIALLQYLTFTFRVGLSRGKYTVRVPKTNGDEQWERIFRVQQNTLEQLTWALLLGLLFIVGRQPFSNLYLKDPPESRTRRDSEYL